MSKHILLFLLSVLPFFAFSQTETDSIPAKKWSFGILLGNNANISRVETYTGTEIGFGRDFTSFESIRQAGLEMGVYISYPLNSYFALQTEPSLAFTGSSYMFSFFNPEMLEFGGRESVNLELPLHLLFEPHNGRFAPSYILGGRQVTDFAAEAESLDPERFRFKKHDLMLDAGIGLNTYFKKFNVRYEVSYSKGLVNQVDPNDAPSRTNPFSSAYNDRLRIRLVFYK